MNTTTTIPAPRLTLPNADRIGVAASVLCAIHCALAPVLLIALPAFGRIWAHPASHILVALFVVPLAAFSIYKGFRMHRKRWVVTLASIGIVLVLGGAALPAWSKESNTTTQAPETGMALPGTDHSAQEGEASECADACCPSLQVNEATGEASLHVPPAAIVTTLGGLFLIAAHIGNLCLCGHACRTGKCADCV